MYGYGREEQPEIDQQTREMPARARRSLAPEDDPRIRRQELAHGIYNFKDVWAYYKKLGWTTKPGPELGYDHYYIKPGKNTKRDVEGEDFFYGEAAIVRYGMKEKIFGEVPKRFQHQPASSSSSRQSTPRRRMSTTSKRESLSESTCNSEGEFDDDASTASSSANRATAKAKRRHSQQQHVPRISSSSSKEKQKHRRRAPGGGHALDAISITSGSTGGSCDGDKSTTTLSLESSDGDDSDGDFRVDAVDDDLEEEEDSDSDSGSDSDDDSESSEEDPNEDDVVVVNAGILASKLKGNFQAKKRVPRPLLSTKKRKAGSGTDTQSFKQESKHAAKKAKSHTSSSSAARNMKSEPKVSVKTSQYAPASKPSAPTSASSGKRKRKTKEPRRLSVETESTATATNTRQTTSQPAPQASRAARTATASRTAVAAPTRASSPPSSPRHSFLSLTALPQATTSSRIPREVAPSTQGSEVYVESIGGDHPASFESDNVSYEPDPEDFDTSYEPAARTKSFEVNTLAVFSSAELDDKPVARPAVRDAAQPGARAARAVAPAPAVTLPPPIVHLQLDEVLFPSQQGQTFRVKISSTETPKQTTIWMEHVQTREQRECKFSDIRMLDGEMTPQQIPEKVIFEALMRCLRSLRSPSSAGGGESQGEKFSAEEPGKVDLLHLDSQSVCLQLMFPCYEFWQKKHQFMMKLVPAHARLQTLVRELDETKRELATTQHTLSAMEAKNQLLETECGQLRTLLRAYQDKEQAHQRLQKLQEHQQEMNQELVQDVQETKPATAATPSVPVAPPPPPAAATSEQMLSPKKPIASRKRDTRSFHARSGWLVSSNASTTLQSSPEKSISWDSVLESAERYFQIVDETNRVVKVLLTGTYQLNLNVTHESCMCLGVWVRSYDAAIGADKTRKLESTLMQFYENKQRVSRLDRVVELNAGDLVSVHLTELGAQRSRSCWLDHFTPQPNIFLLTFLDHELVYKGQAAQEH